MKSKIGMINNEKLSFETEGSPFFSSAGQRKASKALLSLVKGNLDLVYITGDAGAGKTRILSNFLNSVDDQAKTAVIGEQLDSPMEFIHAVAAAFDGMIHGNTTRELHAALLDFLIEHHIEGESFVLAIDNAQNLSNDVFEILESLTELESRDKRIVKLAVLARNGAKINRNIRELCQSDNLNALICEITPFTEIETRAYINRQLSRKAEFSQLELTATGGRRIHYYSGGNPRLINILTTLSARIALKADQRQITRKIVQHAVQTPKWVSISESIPGIHIVKVPGSDERGQYATPKVIVFHNDRKIGEYELDKDKMWVGRDPSSDIRLDLQSVSRRHALITLEDGNVWISNLNSINGTQVNSKPVLRRVLLDGDVIRVANFLLLFIYEEAAHSSGHLKEATQTDLQAQSEIEEKESRDNYFELPTTDSEADELSHAPVAQSPTAPKSRGRKSPLITVSTIASIGLITGAIVISQSGVEKFDISFPRGKAIKPTPIESVTRQDGDANPPMPATPESELSTTTDQPDQTVATAADSSPASQPADQRESGNPPAAEPAAPVAPQQQPDEATLAQLANNLPAAPTPPAPSSDASHEPATAPPGPIENRIVRETPAPAPEQQIPVIEPVTNIFEEAPGQIAYDDARSDSSLVASAPRSEAGFEDLVFASPGAGNIDVASDEPSDNLSALADRRHDDIQFAWNDIDDLLQKGQRQLASLKLTVPAGDNAYDTFMRVLALDPGNAEAEAGLDAIAERYLNIATASKERFNFSHALKMANRGLQVRPDNPALRNLADELTVMASSQPRSGHRFHIQKVPDSELNSRYRIARTPESAFDRQFEQARPIRRISEEEIDALYAQTEPAFIEPVETLPTFNEHRVAQAQPEAPIFIQPRPAPQTFARAPQPLARPEAASAPIATPLPQQNAPASPGVVANRPTVATPAAPAAAAPSGNAPKVASAPAAPAANGPGAQSRATQPAAAQPRQVVPTYLPPSKVATAAPTAAPKPAPISPKTILNVDHLLQKASRQQSIGHYTGPPGDNALETYKRILALEPMNPDALIGLLDIADYYHRESEKLMLLGDPLSALAMIEEGLKVRPDHQGLRQLQTNARLLLEKEAKERGLTSPRATKKERLAAKTARQVDKLTNDARDRLNDKEYSKSLAIIEQGLKLDPNNPDLISLRSEALQSLASLEKKWGEEQKLREQNLARQQRIKFEVNEMKANRLLTKARKAYEQGYYQQALNAVNQGLKIMPENVELVAFKQQIEKNWDSQTRKQASSAVRKVVAGIVDKARKAHASGDLDETMRLVNTGLTIDPANVDLKVLRLEVEKTREIEALKRKAEAKRRELEAMKHQASSR